MPKTTLGSIIGTAPVPGVPSTGSGVATYVDKIIRQNDDPWTALVVEDDAIIAFDFEDRLASLGASDIRIARDVEHALEIARDMRPTVALVDWRLGESTSAALAENLVRSGVKVAIVSGSSRWETRFPGDEDVIFLTKPLSDEALEKALTTLLARC